MRVRWRRKTSSWSTPARPGRVSGGLWVVAGLAHRHYRLVHRAELLHDLVRVKGTEVEPDCQVSPALPHREPASRHQSHLAHEGRQGISRGDRVSARQPRRHRHTHRQLRQPTPPSSRSAQDVARQRPALHGGKTTTQSRRRISPAPRPQHLTRPGRPTRGSSRRPSSSSHKAVGHRRHPQFRPRLQRREPVA